MTRAPHDYHMHSHFSHDCQIPMREMCQAAIDQGIAEIGFTEHFDLFPRGAPWTNRLDLPSWSLEIENCRRAFDGSLRILRGLEFGEPHLFDDEFQRVAAQYPFDYILGSLHWVGEYNIFDPKYFQRGYFDSFGDFFAELEQMTSKPRFDVLSHFDVVARQGVLHFPQYNPTNFETQIRRILQNCVNHGIALDLNTSAMRQKAQIMTPNYQVLKWYKELGGDRVTLGADAHLASDVGAHFSEALNLLESVGLKHLSSFKKRSLVPVGVE